jgi:hypothetical protein
MESSELNTNRSTSSCELFVNAFRSMDAMPELLGTSARKLGKRVSRNHDGVFARFVSKTRTLSAGRLTKVPVSTTVIAFSAKLCL